MQTLPREDFPSLPEGTGSYSALLPRDILKQMVAKTQFAITGEDTRYFLNGALFILRPDSMGLVSTDGHRLALISVPREKGKSKGKSDKADDEVRVILPRKTLLELGRLLADGDGDIQYERGENHLFFDIGGRLLISRMIDGQFPAFERVIPKSNDKRVEFDRDRLTSAVKRVALLSNERSRAVKFQIDKGKVEIASSSPEFGEAKEVLMVDYTAAPVTICFNAQYVLDFLAVVETESVSLEFKDEMSQAVMKPVGADGYDYTYVIMPMRV
jgi:DNA polymerase-3 subunit beta